MAAQQLVLQHIREHYGSQRAFSDHLGIPHQTVSHWVCDNWTVGRDPRTGRLRLYSPRRSIPEPPEGKL